MTMTPTSADNVPSPCDNVCDFDFDRGVCAGCLRTLEEIARWETMTPDQKREVLVRIELRRRARD